MMDSRKPNYKLQRVFSDGTESTPRMYKLDKYDPSLSFGRRDFLKTSIIPLGGLLLTGCGGGSNGGGPGTSGVGMTDQEFYDLYVNSHMGLSKVLFSPDGAHVVSIGSNLLRFWGDDNLSGQGISGYRPPGSVGSATEIGEIKDFVFTLDSLMIVFLTSKEIFSL